jgi:outer membrane lipoprotein-sorting protein
MNNQNDCQNRREAITAFVLGQLEPQTADELKKHIDTCETCQSLYQALIKEEKTIRSTFQAITDRSESLQDSLIELFARREPLVSRTDKGTIKTIKIIGKAIMKSPVTKLAAAVIIVLLIIAIIELGKPIGGASVAFAAAMDRVKQARTFSCTGIFEVTYEAGRERGKYLMKQKWMFKEPDRERHETLTSAPPWPKDVGEVTIWHYGKRQRLQFRPFDKTAEFHDMSSDYLVDADTGKLELTQLDTSLRDRLLKWSAGAVEDLGSVELNGQSVRVLQSRRDNRFTTVWIDPETNYPVQIEHKWTDQSHSPVMYTSIQIDAELDDDLFSLEPPEGYHLRRFTEDWPLNKKKLSAKMMHLLSKCAMFASKHNDQYPKQLTDLKAVGITDDVLKVILAPADRPDAPAVIRYLPPRPGADWSKEVVMYEVHDTWPDDGIVVGFADVHCEIIPNQDRFADLIR